MAKRKLTQPDIKMDLTPMIDVIFLLIIFFILAGRITDDITNENITVPPTKTAEKWEKTDWQDVRVEVWGNTQNKGDGRSVGHTIKIGGDEFRSRGYIGEEAFIAYQGLRQKLDTIYDLADKFPDPKKTGITLPKVVIELRADGDTEYRVIQEIIQVLTDSVSPFPGPDPTTGKMEFMRPSTKKPAQAKPFININYTTRTPADES